MTAPTLLTYELTDAIATIRMDDGKANVMSLAMLTELHAAFERAEREAQVVVLTGRKGIFSGGYDLAMFKQTPQEIVRTLRAGGELTYRILSFPKPVIIACPGHAIAQGGFTLLAADVRIGVNVPDRKIGLNEVAIGLTIPHYGVELARARLTPAAFNHACTTGAIYNPEAALTAGFLDQLVAPEALETTTQAEAKRLLTLNMPAHAATKLRVRAPTLKAMRSGIDEELRING